MDPYLTNNVYITKNKRISNKLIQAILFFLHYCFTHFSSLIVTLFAKIIFFNSEFNNTLIIALVR